MGICDFVSITVVNCLTDFTLLLFRVICPLEGIVMLIWWIVDEIRLNADPYKEGAFWTFTSTSLINILTQVNFVLLDISSNFECNSVARPHFSHYSFSLSFSFSGLH